MTDSWNDLMAGSLDDAATDRLLRRTLADLDKIIESRAHAYDDIVAIVDKNLSLPLDEGTITTMSDTLSSYLQSDAGQILVWIAYDRANRLAQLSKFDNPQALELVRRISTSFGRHLQRALSVSNGWRDDWDYIGFSVGFDQTSSTYRLRFDLTKITGDRVRVESPPDSFMILCTYLLGMLRDVGTRDPFSEGVLQGFNDRVDEVQKVLSAPLASTAAAAKVPTTAGG